MAAFQIDLKLQQEALGCFFEKNIPCGLKIIAGLDKLGKEHDTKIFIDSWNDMKTVVLTYKEGSIKFVTSFSSDCTTLNTLLNSPDVIDISQDNAMIRTPLSIKENLSYQLLELPRMVRYSYHGSTLISLNQIMCLPEGFKSDFIHLSDFTTVASKWLLDQTWTGARDFLYHLLTNYPSVGIYDTTVYPHRLVSWALSSGLGIIYHLNTLKEYHRRGFARVVIKELTNKILSNGLTPLADIVETNIASRTLFTSCGFGESYSLTVCVK